MSNDAPRGTFGDLAYLVDCHKATGCLFQSTTYGHQVHSGQISGKAWDLGRLNDGVRFLMRDVESKLKQGEKHEVG